jgi:hypothetical protein
LIIANITTTTVIVPDLVNRLEINRLDDQPVNA